MATPTARSMSAGREPHISESRRLWTRDHSRDRRGSSLCKPLHHQRARETQSSPPTLALERCFVCCLLYVFASCPTVSYYTVVWEGGHI